MQYLISFLKSPLGFIFNLLATITVYINVPNFVDKFICKGCQSFCINDGIQDDCMF
jgi:hypothetical protein